MIPDPKLRLRFKRAMSGLITEVPCLGLTATEAAFVSALLRRRRQPSLSCHYDVLLERSAAREEDKVD